MQRNFLILICSLTSFVGLILIYIATLNIQPTPIKLNEINSDLIGRKVITQGEIVYKRTHVAGHLFLTISDDNDKIQVPLFSSFMGNLKENGYTEDDFGIGTKILISGLVDEYNGELQLTPKRLNDIEILSE